MAVAAAASHETARLQISLAGLDRAEYAAHGSPLDILAVLEARLGKNVEAFERWEAGLARGLFEDLAARRSRPLAGGEAQRQESLITQIGRLDNQIAVLGRTKALPDAGLRRLDDLRNERLVLQGQLVQFEAELVKRYQVAAGALYGLRQIQWGLAADAALVGWLDIKTYPKSADPKGDHWACVVRRTGEPAWLRIAGTGADGAWTKADDSRLPEVRRSLSASSAPASLEALGELAKQRLHPLEPALQARGDLPPVRHLIVLPSPALAGIPVEALRGGAPGRLAALSRQLRSLGHDVHVASRAPGRGSGPKGAPRRLLAVGDPLPPRADEDVLRSPVSPDHGILDRAGDSIPAQIRGARFDRLPGARREIESIARLFDQKDVFLGSDASELLVDGLRAHDGLKQFAVIHFATHGKMDDLMPMNSRLLLSQDRMADPLQQTPLDQPFHDGTLTAGEVMRSWKLQAELVTLSACQSGLGRSSGGEGFIGFAQALFLAGARSLVLSLWEVDDRATSLLMTRFYENWLGKRAGLKKPLPKAEALDEAKQWLRGLTSDEAEAELEQITRGEPRAKQGQPVAGRPFEHPHYWAGFILMGDAN